MVITATRVSTGGSPVSDDGRGLKLITGHFSQRVTQVRPSVMTGVD